MPDFYSNYIIIKGSCDLVGLFKEACNLPNSEGFSSVFSFHQTVPIPTNKEDRQSCIFDYLNKKNINIDYSINPKLIFWGTRGDACYPNIMFGINQVTIQCQTTSPPIKWAENYFNSLSLENQQTTEITIAFYMFAFGHYGTVNISHKGIIVKHDDIEYNDKSKLDDFLREYGIC